MLEMFHTLQSQTVYRDFLKQLDSYNQFHKNIVEQMCNDTLETRSHAIKLMG